jgi:hypothetical protein
MTIPFWLHVYFNILAVALGIYAGFHLKAYADKRKQEWENNVCDDCKIQHEIKGKSSPTHPRKK